MNYGVDNFYTSIQQSLLSQPGKEFLVWDDERFTGKDILHHVDGLRNALLKQKVKSTDHVLVAQSFKAQTLFLILAIMANGAIPVLPPARSSFKQIFQLLFQLPIQWIALNDNVNLIGKILLRLLDIKLIRATQPFTLTNTSTKVATVPPNQSALITHSSGSTGKPKAIFRSHSVLTAQHAVLKKIFPPMPRQHDLPLFPAILLHNLAVGVTSVIPDIPNFDVGKLQPEKILTQLNKQGITSLTGNVFYFKQLLDHLQQHPCSLENITAVGIGGSPVPEYLLHDLKKWFLRADVYVIYGSSEAEPITLRKVEEDKQASYGFCVGAPVKDIDLKIDELGTICLDGQSFAVGEIAVRGEHVVAKKEDPWYRTGDYGYLSDENILYLTARKGNEKIISGVQHYQLEHVMMNTPGIEHAAAIARADQFDVYFSGNAKEADVQNLLHRHFSPTIIGQLHSRNNLPVDNRHFSKIIYKKVC